MSTREERERLELLQGALDVLILRMLILGPRQGQGIARAIQQTSERELLVDHGALISRAPAPGRTRLDRGQVWNLLEQPQGPLLFADGSGPQAAGKETSKWNRLTKAIARILGAEAMEG